MTPTAGLPIVGFRFNAWGNRWHPHDADARVPELIARHLDLPFYRAPFVLEGGAFMVDGEGTVLTTEQCLLDPNRNPELDRAQIEDGLRAYLGADTVVWLPFGHSLDVGPEATDGHLDGIASYVGPAHVLLEAPVDPAATEHVTGRANALVLEAARDAAGRSFTISRLDPGPTAQLAYANLYLANGAAIVPLAGDPNDEPVLAWLRDLLPDREVVGVPGAALNSGGRRAPLHHAAGADEQRCSVSPVQHSPRGMLRRVMRSLETRDAADRVDGTPQAQRLRAISPDVGAFLRLLVEAAGARTIIEVGTSSGYSSLWLALGASRTGGHVTTFDVDPAKVALARTTFAEAGVEALVDVRLEDGVAGLREHRGVADVVFLDAEKGDYLRALEPAIEALRPGGLLIADNLTSHADDLVPFRDAALGDPRLEGLVVPIGRGELVAVRR